MSYPITRQRNAQSSRRTRSLLVALSVGAFTLGTSETMPVGILGQLSESVGRPESSVGALVTVYALSLATGGVILGFLTAQWTRRDVMALALGTALVANTVMATSDSFDLLLVARVAGGSAHGLFVGAAISVAISVVAADRAGRAISVVLTGLAASTALGVPAGVVVAEALGWHASFGTVAALGAVLLMSVWVLTPATPASAGTGTAPAVRAAFAPQVLRPLGLAVLLFTGEYAAFTFINPFLHEVSGVSNSTIGIFVLAFGLAAAVGSGLGGRFADWNAPATVALASAMLPVILLALLVLGRSATLAFAIFVAWGLVVIIFVPAIQYLVAVAAGPARDVAAVLPAAAINLGIAMGSVLGGVGFDWLGAGGPVLVAAILCATSVPLTVTGWVRSRPAAMSAAHDSPPAPNELKMSVVAGAE